LKNTAMFLDDKPLYNFGTEYTVPYFDHMNKLHKSLHKVHPKSGICHHMIFKKSILAELFNMIEKRNKKDLWISFIENVDQKNNPLYSGASEYEIYFTYINIFHEDEFIVRSLKWKNTDTIVKEDLDYITIHYYNRNI
jgi:hypothetical protein